MSDNSHKLPAYVYAIAGASGGLSNVLLLHPMDTLRTRFQARSFSLPGSYYTNLIQASYSIIRQEGFWALYKGMGPALVGSMISWSLYFQSYHLFKSRLSSWGETVPTHLTASTCAGIVTSLVTNPFWLVKTRLQLQIGQVKHRKSVSSNTIPTHYRGMVHGLFSIVREEGLVGLYRGIGPSLLLVSHGAIQLTIYEYCKTWFLYRNGDWKRQRDRTLHVTESLIASTVSKVMASITTYPLQVIRTRMQETSLKLYFLESFRCIVQMEGLKALYRGLFANLLRVTPSAALTFLTYEQVIRLYSVVFI
ncbi:Folate transporter 1, chloroplastic [Galdieria sulphuraria]|nr:Folate transporter 1, chloroplastic [Galdieria sulphuraria]